MMRWLPQLKASLLLRLRSHPTLTLLQACVDSELTAAQRRRIMRHATRCERCAYEIDSRRSILDSLDKDSIDADLTAIADLRQRIFATVDSTLTARLEEDVHHLLGLAATSEIGRPGQRGTPALRQQLAAFLGVRAAEHLATGWLDAESHT